MIFKYLLYHYNMEHFYDVGFGHVEERAKSIIHFTYLLKNYIF